MHNYTLIDVISPTEIVVRRYDHKDVPNTSDKVFYQDEYLSDVNAAPLYGEEGTYVIFCETVIPYILLGSILQIGLL